MIEYSEVNAETRQYSPPEFGNMEWGDIRIAIPETLDDLTSYRLETFNSSTLSGEVIEERVKRVHCELMGWSHDFSTGLINTTQVTADALTDSAHLYGREFYTLLMDAVLAFQVEVGWVAGERCVPQLVPRDPALPFEETCDDSVYDCQYYNQSIILDLVDLIHFCVFSGGDINTAIRTGGNNYDCEVLGLD